MAPLAMNEQILKAWRGGTACGGYAHTHFSDQQPENLNQDKLSGRRVRIT